ncbi:MAG: DNA repair protein RadA [Negativicutes bacterium]|nr:DNA repair protein RadA [Negativicutes bacterium]
MAKTKSVFVCRECGFDSPRWVGRCPGCNAWNTMVEERIQPVKGTVAAVAKAAKPQLLKEFSGPGELRKPTGIGELDRVLGGGVVDGSLVLIGGDPGIGKSTLLLSAAAKFAGRNGNVLYVSGEESAAQTGLRARRTGALEEKMWIMAETNLDNILAEALQMSPAMVVIDSIQTVFCPETPGAAGSISQVRESTGRLLRFAKDNNIPVMIVGHVTKDGNIAGPRLLEHMVDTVLYFEGERNYAFRVLRPIKNRFGTIAESGIFSMEQEGLVEVKNPSQFLLTGRSGRVSGTIITACLEGIRPLLIEIQALVSTTCFGLPRRTTVGFDANRLGLLLAVLEKRQGLLLGNQDVYLNAVGGFRLVEPAADLAVALAVASSFRDRALLENLVAFGEVGLSGEIRPVPRVLQRVREAVNLGFTSIMIPWANLAELQKESLNVKLIGVKNLSQAMEVGLP